MVAQGVEACRRSIVAPARLSRAAEPKVYSQQTNDGDPARSFDTLLKDLSTLAKNETRIQGSEATFHKHTRPTPLQQKALDLLGVSFRM
jgi:hypothetical protein